MSFPRYQNYKDSGSEWLGEVPETWHVGPLKRMIQKIESGTSVNASDEPARDGKPGVLKTSCVYTGTFDPNENKAVVEEDIHRVSCPLKAGTLIVSRMNTPDLIGAAGLVTQNRGDIFLPDRLWQISFSNADTRFIHFWTLTSVYRGQVKAECTGTSSTMKNLGQNQFTSFSIATPSLVEQANIADFLVRETAKIDGLVMEQRRLMELLKEKRQAVISHAVTKGLNPHAPMKPSGVEWLGDVPTHWEISQSRRMFIVRSEPALASDRMLTASQKYGVLFQADFVELEGRRVAEVIMGTESLKHVEPDDFIISMRSFQGGIEWCKLRGSTSFHYVMIKPVKGVYPPFFAHLFKSVTYIQALRATTDLIRDGQELRYSNFVQIDLPLIPMEEQKRIASFLDGEIPKLDALTLEAQRTIGLLQERRTALISAAVTGQIDVRSTHINDRMESAA